VLSSRTRPNAKPSALKKQRDAYSGKQKCRTIKDRIIINGATGEIICVAEAKGAVHDMELFKQSGVHIADDILLVGDKGYQGLPTLHANRLTPFKKPKNGELTPLQKALNSNLSRYRIRIEHVNRRIKRFKILQMRYRNKQRKHLLRVSLICGIYNCELRF
jgi:hypothetical protein